MGPREHEAHGSLRSVLAARPDIETRARFLAARQPGGVQGIGSGDLAYRLNLKTGDEMEILADEFNKMTSQLQESYVNLEQKVDVRTRELTESLEQQTATSQVLGVISSSPRDLQPVFETMLANATRLGSSDYGAIFRFNGEVFSLVTAQYVSPHMTVLADRTFPPDPRTAVGRVGLEKKMVHIPDVTADPNWNPPEEYRKEGIRSVLAVPMLKENNLVGAIVVYRRAADDREHRVPVCDRVV